MRGVNSFVLTLTQESTRIRYGITRMYKINWREEANYLRDLLYSL